MVAGTEKSDQRKYAMDIQWLLRLPQPITGSGTSVAAPLALRAGDLLTASVLDVGTGRDALLAFDRFTAYARLPQPIVPGQKVQVRVEKKGDRLRMVMVPDKMGPAVTGPGGNRMEISLFEPVSDRALPGAHSRSLATGTSTQRTMASSLAAGATETRPGPPPAPVFTDMPVLREKVQQLIDGNFHPASAAPNPLPASLKDVLNHLQQILHPASQAGDTFTLAARVRDFVENSGLYFEKHLAAAIGSLQDSPVPRSTAELAAQPAIRNIMVKDLKPNLLMLKEFIASLNLDSDGPDRRMLQTLKSEVQKALSYMEHQQFMATKKPVDPDLFQVFSHLLLLGDTDRNARLKVYYAKKGRSDDQKQPRVSLLLEMDRLGTVRSDLWMVAKDLNVTFFVQDIGTKAAIENGHHRIGKMLKDIFDTVSVSVVVNEEKIAAFDGEEMTPSDSRQVDLSI